MSFALQKKRGLYSSNFCLRRTKYILNYLDSRSLSHPFLLFPSRLQEVDKPADCVQIALFFQHAVHHVVRRQVHFQFHL